MDGSWTVPQPPRARRRGGRSAGEVVERNDDVCAQRLLRADRRLWRQVQHPAVAVRAEAGAWGGGGSRGGGQRRQRRGRRGWRGRRRRGGAPSSLTRTRGGGGGPSLLLLAAATSYLWRAGNGRDDLSEAPPSSPSSFASSAPGIARCPLCANEKIWKPPLSVMSGRDSRPINLCSPPAASTAAGPGCTSRWRVLLNISSMPAASAA